MAFTYNVLTFSGTQLLAQASASNQLVYIGAVGATVDYIDIDLQQMEDPADARWDISGGFVVAASATNITARIIAGFTNQASSVTMKTVGIVARLASQSDSDAVVLACVSDPNASIRIPSTAEPACRIEIPLNLSITDELAVTVTTSTAGSAMLSDLDRLVSCHKAGQPYTGEDQDVYGTKRFMAYTHFGYKIKNYGKVDVTIGTNDFYHNSFIRSGTQASSEDDPIYQELRFHSYEDQSWTHCITTNVSIMPDSANAIDDVNLGGMNAKFDFIYTKAAICDEVDLKGGSIYLSPNDYSSSVGELTTQGVNAVYLKSYNGAPLTVSANSGQLRLYGDTGIEVTGNTVLTGTFTAGGIAFNDSLSQSTCHLIPRTSTMKAGGIFLAYIVNTSTTYNLYAGDLIPATMLISAAKVSQTAQGTSGNPVDTVYSAGTEFVNDGSSFRIMAEVDHFASGKAIVVPVICVKDSAEQT